MDSVLTQKTDAGDVLPKPSGTWKALHDRCLLGDGTADTHNWVLSAEHMGLRGDYAQVGGPRGLACYSAGNQYFHGGASLQEALVPVLSVKMSQKVAERDAVQFRVSYKRNSPRITTKLPVFEIETIQQDLFANDQSYDLLVRAVAPDGKVVGEPKPGGAVNAATGTVTVAVGTTIKLTVQMSMAYEGKFAVQLLDPNTLAVHRRSNSRPTTWCNVMDKLDEKLLRFFEGKVVRKDLLHRIRRARTCPRSCSSFSWPDSARVTIPLKSKPARKQCLQH